LENLVLGVIVGLIAAWGGYELGFELRVVLSLVAVPAVFGLVDILATPLFYLFLAFGLGALLWTYTPLPEAAVPFVHWVNVETSPSSLPRF
jgi:hypothetical protein